MVISQKIKNHSNRKESKFRDIRECVLGQTAGVYSDLTLLLIWITFNTQTHGIYVELTADRGVPV